MSKKFYAIKIGNNVKDLIVTTWEECQKYVIGYPAIYKGFDDKWSAEEYLNSMDEASVKRNLAIKQQFADTRKKSKYIKKEDKVLKEIYTKYDSLYGTIGEIMDKLNTAEYKRENVYNDLDKVEATILEGLDMLHKYIVVFEEEL